MISAPFSSVALALAPVLFALDEPEPLCAVPREAVVVVDVDVARLLSEGSRSSWYRFFADERLGELRAAFSRGFSLDAELAAMEWPTAAELAEATGRLTLFATAGEERPAAVGLVAAELPGKDALRRVLGRLVSQLEGSPPETWRDFDVHTWQAERGLDLEPISAAPLRSGGAFSHPGGWMILLGDRPEDTMALARGAARRLRGAEAAGSGVLDNSSFRDARAQATPGRQIEMWLDIAALAPRPSPGEREGLQLHADLRSIPWIAFDVRVGAGEDHDARLATRFAKGGFLGRFFGLFRPASRELLKLLPADSATFSTGSFDVEGFVELVMEAVRAYAPERYEGFEAGTAHVEQLLGVDPFEDLLGQLSGDFASFQRAPQAPVPAGDRREAARAMMELQVATTLVGLRDGEAFGDALEQALTATGLIGLIGLEELEGHDVHSFGLGGAGPSLYWTVTDDLLAVSPSPADLRHVLGALADEETPSVATSPRFAAALEASEGACFVSVSDTRSVLNMVGQTIDLLATSVQLDAPSDDPLLAFAEALTTSGDLSRVIEDHFEGLYVSLLVADSGGLELRMFGE